MTADYSEIMRKFAERQPLSKKHHLVYNSNVEWPYLELDSPLVLARFSAVIKQAVAKKHPGAKVYCRGQNNHFDSMRPSLFRAPNDKYPTQCLLQAEEDFVTNLKKASKARRFQREHLPALLQHYGVRTSWLDVVDNLSERHLFPDDSDDNTLKVLRRNKHLLCEAEERNGLCAGALGSL